ncbi:MAG: GLPGLI family protein [Gemmatimonadales bacterium]|nr:MAG: GLPGLI family protein [Gemmatimonadales bacterium]
MKLPWRVPLPVLLCLYLPGALASQEGAITFDRAIRLALELPPELQERLGDQIPGESFDSFVLLFSAAETVMIPAPEEVVVEAEATSGSDVVRSQRLRGAVSRLQRMSPERSDQERLMVAHVDLASGAVVENRTFMGRVFLINGSRPSPEWRLTGEQSEFAGYMVMKAVAEAGDRQIEAWFTPQIPVPGGPGEYGGLPGMILSLSIDQGRILYSATGVSMTAVDAGAIRPPSQGEEVTREEYESIVAEKLEELKLLQSQRRRRRPGGGL